MKIIMLLFIVTLGTVACNDTEELVDAQGKVNAFLIDMNPELHQAMSKIREEIALADKKIQQLYDLKAMFPNQREMIDKSLKQWQGLRKNLYMTLNNIYDKVEAAYVAYRIDEIQGRKKFSVISKTLLKKANAVLTNAETTKSIIEKLYE